MVSLEWTIITSLHFFDDLRHTIGSKKRRAFALLDIADLFGYMGTLIQQRQQLLVERVDLYA